MLKPIVLANQLAPNREHLLYSIGLAETLNADYSNVQVRLTGVHLSLPSDRSETNEVHAIKLPAYGLFLDKGRDDDDYITLEMDFSGRGLLDTLKVKWDNYFVYLSFIGVLSLHRVTGAISLKASRLKLIRVTGLDERHMYSTYGPGLAIANLMATGELVGFDLEFKAGNPKLDNQE